MTTLNNDLKPVQPEEPSLTKMVMFSTGYFLNIFLMVAFTNFVWTFYADQLGLRSFMVYIYGYRKCHIHNLEYAD